MSSRFKSISDAYQQLSKLYKNPTRNGDFRPVDGIAASNVNGELITRYRTLLKLFSQQQALLLESDKVLYYKILALLYEIDDYRGVEFPHRTLIVNEGRNLIRGFVNKPNREGNRPFDRFDFTESRLRSEVKAKIRCCVAAIESRRREEDVDELTRELNTLQRFINDNLHRPPKQPAWTTLAFVLSAQARLARQSENHEESQHKLLEEVRCLNQRAAEIVNRLSNKAEAERLNEEAIEDLKDDLVFIRRKQTLSSFFNVGLAAFQRGFLKTANQACQSARLQFRLHGQFFHEVFNELIILSIKRARTSRGQQHKFEDLKRELEQDILPCLDPDTGAGNPKLFFYGLRELAVLQYYCEESDMMIDTLDRMDDLMKRQKRKRNQWKSRVSNQRARAFWRNWVREQDCLEPESALKHAQDAFTFASNLTEKISEYRDARALRSAIERSKRISLIDTIESLVTYGSIQASAKQFAEAIKSANAVIQLARENNPRLCAMGYLIRGEAYIGNGQLVEARQDIKNATDLEKRIDHRYVGDRRRFVQRLIENSSPLEFFFRGLEAKDFKKKGTNRLLGWFIETYSKKKNRNEVSKAVGVSRDRLDKYRTYLENNESEPYQHLITVLAKHEDAQTDEKGNGND